MPDTKQNETIAKEEAPKIITKSKKASAIHFKSGQGKMYVKSTFNTTYVSFTNMNGDVICWSSAGTCGFKGAKRPGPGKDAALRVLKTSGVDINLLADTTPIPHNGCRPKKTRRV